ncbi:MAG: DNA translocase FtsK 4TM domain-containing protein [Thermoanaerobaculales bacterium]|jgi:S-DNA-T family DNA segregation ATPase FtsK/SpoIIIE|nr:DNA translocase FtsK 4TM domain-containing protein [Thermoanaerobaculales bacterium]
MSRERLVSEMIAVGLIFGSVLAATALLSHSPLDPSPLHASTLRGDPVNLAGALGAALSALLFGLLGVVALVLPVVGLAVGWRMLRDRPVEHPKAAALGWGLIVVALPGVASLLCSGLPWRDGAISCGGLLGRAEAELLGGVVGPVGRVVVLGFLIVFGVVLVSGLSVGSAAGGVADGLEQRWLRRRDERARRKLEAEEARNRRRVLERQVKRLEGEEGYRGSLTVKEVEGKGRFRIQRRVTGADEPEVEPDGAPEAEPLPEAAKKRRPAPRAAAKEPAAKKPVVQEEFEFIEDLEKYDLPRTSFLDESEGAPERDSAALVEMSKLITSKCQEFRVRGEVSNIRTGPVITTYEFRLDSGVKISAVQNLAEDLALALRTESVRIERVPGRATVGIEVPSPDPEVIRLRQIIESNEFQRAGSLLALALGVDIRGKPFVSDLARMPHLLIGGFTGSGKSVGINAMIMSILYKAKPDEVKFILVDPKMVELGVYSDIPHLLTPIISDPKKAASALGWAVAEMDNRYRRLASLGVRNLEQHNQLVTDPVQLRRAQQKLGAADDDEPARLEPLPYIVIIIDELADLMMTSSRAVEESITRLAQKARAVGVHLICATQRPSVDVLTGIIKANFPCRVAYKVRSKFDSRTILDSMGAEHLIGRGDMLYLPPGTSTLLRLHGPLVTEKEIATVVRYIKRFGKPEYQRNVLTHQALGGDGKSARPAAANELDELSDPMYDAAARLVVETRKASASYIQRRLHLGYTRSARLLDMMEKEGIVGPLAGSKGREVLVPKNHFAEVDATHALNDDEPDPS